MFFNGYELVYDKKINTSHLPELKIGGAKGSIFITAGRRFALTCGYETFAFQAIR
jgi:hypothetical protein